MASTHPVETEGLDRTTYYADLLNMPHIPFGCQMHYVFNPPPKTETKDEVVSTLLQRIDLPKGWTTSTSIIPATKNTPQTLQFAVKTSHLVAPLGIQVLCCVLSKLYNIEGIRPLDLHLYISASGMRLNDIKSITQHLLLFKNALVILFENYQEEKCFHPDADKRLKDHRVQPQRCPINRVCTRLSTIDAYDSVAGCTSLADLCSTMRFSAKSLLNLNAVNRSTDTGSTTAEFPGFLEFHQFPGSLHYRDVQPWLCTLLLLVSCACEEASVGVMTALQKRRLLRKFDQWEGEVRSMEAFHDLFDTLIRHAPLYQIYCFRVRHSGHSHYPPVRPFLGFRDQSMENNTPLATTSSPQPHRRSRGHRTRSTKRYSKSPPSRCQGEYKVASGAPTGECDFIVQNWLQLAGPLRSPRTKRTVERPCLEGPDYIGDIDIDTSVVPQPTEYVVENEHEAGSTPVMRFPPFRACYTPLRLDTLPGACVFQPLSLPERFIPSRGY